jgi:hypothetical protein
MHIARRHRLEMNKTILINARMHTEAIGRFQLATAVPLHMSARVAVLRRLAVTA